MSARLRVMSWTVQPVLVAVDEDTLDVTPIPVGPQSIAAGDWEAFKNGGDQTAIDQLRAQVEGGGGPKTAPPPPPNGPFS